MSYCTVDQVQARNHAILDSLSDAVVNEAIEQAQDMVDGMLRSGYPVPLPTVPASITKITADIAASYLLSDHVGNSATNEEPLQAKELYDRALERLKMIQDGTEKLDVELPAGTEETSVMKQARCTTYGNRRCGSLEYWDPSNPRSYPRRRGHRRR